jgi:hypothetical protein
MLCRSQIGIFAIAMGLLVTTSAGQAADDTKYPNWKGQWFANNQIVHGQVALVFDPTKTPGPGQQAPLTPEYQKVLEDSMADQANGGLGNYPPARCVPGGMPRMMSLPQQEFVITPEPDRRFGLLPPHLHRRTRLAEGFAVDLSRLFDRPMDCR